MHNNQLPAFWKRSPAARIALIYTTISVLWIAFSDQVLFFLIDDPVLVTRLQTLKGWAFVLFSGGLLWGLIHSDYVVRRELEVKFRRSESRFRRVFECAGQGIWMLDARGHTLLINHWFSEVLGWDLTSPHGMPAQRWLRKTNFRAATEIFRRVKRGLTVQREMQTGGRTLLINAIPLLDELRKFDGMVIIVSDISELATARNELRSALRSHTVLLHEIHHRVRNNLQLVVSMLNIQARETTYSDLNRFVKQSESWVKTIAAAHHLAYESDSLRNVMLNDLVHEIIRNVQQTVAGSIRFEWKIAAVSIPLETAVTLGLLLNQLLYRCSEHQTNRQIPLIVEGVLDHDLLRLRVPCAFHDSEDATNPIQAELIAALAGQLNARITEEKKSVDYRLAVIEFPLQSV